MKILIMTRSGPLARRLTQQLCGMGYPESSIVTSDRAAEAAGALARNRECLILWDCAMEQEPQLLLDELKKWDICSDLILLADRPDEEILSKGLRLRAAEVLPAGAAAPQLEEAVRRSEAYLKNLGLQELKTHTFWHMRFAAVGQCMRGFLMHSVNDGDLDLMEELGQVPWRNRLGWMALIHVTNRSENADVDRTMISTSIGNVVEELAEPLNEMRAMTWMSESIYALFMQHRVGPEPEREQIMDILRQTRKFLEQYLNWKVNFYVAGPFFIRDAPEVWETLDACRKENVALYPGVFHLDQWHGTSDENQSTRILDLRRFLTESYPDLIEQESNQLLMEMANSRNAGRKQLRDFCQEFMKMVYSVMWENGWEASELIRTDEDMEIMNNAVNTVADMKVLIHHVSQYFCSKCASRNTKSAVQLLRQYITDHYAEPLSRKVLAEYIHLNPDYMARIFQKEMGCSIKDYITGKRMEAAKLLLRSTALPIGEIATMVGYENYSYFTQSYRKEFGITPKQERLDAKEHK